MILETMKVGPLECNCSIVVCPETKEALVVDPGGDAERILDRIDSLGATVKYALITHAHFDHVLAAAALQKATNAKICLHCLDRRMYRLMGLQYKMFGVKGAQLPPRPQLILKDGDELTVGKICTKVIHTPGHSPGSCCFHIPEQKMLFSGDTLFRESIGQTQSPGGSFEVLMQSIHERLMVLDDDTRVIPGHMDETTIGHERANNPYLRQGIIEQNRISLQEVPLRERMFKYFFELLVGGSKAP